MKAVEIIGNRPQYIKSVLVNRELAKRCKLILVNTGQHYSYEMADIFFQELGILPNHDLEVGSGSHAEQTAKTMLRLEPILMAEKPDVVLVYGDTNSTIGATLTAAKLGIPVAHIEAGPRQCDLKIPEEVNRITTDHLSTYCFAPTESCVDNLRDEGISPDRVFNTGDVMLDNFLHFSQQVHGTGLLNDTILVTLHRPINTDAPYRLKQILSALCRLKEDIIFPMHPRTTLAVAGVSNESLPQNIQVCKPFGYLEMLATLKNVRLVVTDSGGLQKEAFFAGVPCLTLDVCSPWPETVDAGWNRVVRPSELVEAVKEPPRGSAHDTSAFGDGQAHKKIVEVLVG